MSTSHAACPVCGAPVAEAVAYCGRCGSGLHDEARAPCPECEQVNPSHARFCMSCGASLTLAVAADRRVVSVLFADLSGFTELTEQVDAEDVHDLIAGCLERLSECVTRWGGHVDKFIGDCVMALFGAPVAYENEAERAVRAGLDMQEALERWSGQGIWAGHRPRLSVGINTGPVVTGVFSGGGTRDYTAVGDTVNVASRLQGLCEPGRVLVDATTYEQTRHIFDYGEEAIVHVKGRREPVRVRLVIGLKAERARARGFLGKRTALVGRRAELEALGASWIGARAGTFELCMVTGAPGIGKSRLIEEFLAAEALDGLQAAWGRCYPYSSSTPWEPIAELVRDLYGVSPEHNAGEAARAVAASSAGDWTPVDVAALTIALGGDASEIAELQSRAPDDRHDRIVAAVTRALGPGDDVPRFLVLEDLHWADRASLDFLARAASLELRGPALLVLVSRPPLPRETLLARVVESVGSPIAIGPLAPDECRSFVDALLETHEIPSELLDQIVARSDGNPLYLEETLKALVGRGVLVEEGDVWRVSDAVGELEVPDSIESVLTTRMEGLDRATRSVLQYAAVVGRRFWSGVLAEALARRPVDREMDDLVDGNFVRSSPHSVVRGDREFVFEHLMLQEVAYEGLLRGLRSELHGGVARWLEERAAAEGSEFDELVAHHYERSKEPERALPFLESAAHGARERGSLLDAASLLARAVRIARDPGEVARLLGEADDVATMSGDVARRREIMKRLETLAEQGADPAIGAGADYRKARFLLDSGALEPARSAAAAAALGFERLGDISKQADALSLLGRVAHLRGEYVDALRDYSSALALERRAGDDRGEAVILDRLGLVEVDRDHFTAALEYLDEARTICARLGDRALEARVAAHRATGLRWLGQYAAAEAAAREALELARQSGSRRAESAAGLSLGAALAAASRESEAGELLTLVSHQALDMARPHLEARAWLELAQIQTGEEARGSAARAQEIARRTGLVHVEILALTRKAALALEAGDLAAADRDSAEAARRLERQGYIPGPEERVYYTRGRVLSALGRDDVAGAFLEHARNSVRSKARLIEDADLRRAFLCGIELNRQILGPELEREVEALAAGRDGAGDDR